MGTADDTGEWRCKTCGKRQSDPDSPCENCWNTTFVAGEGATQAAGDTGIAGPPSQSDPSLTRARVAQAKTATARAGVTCAVLAGGVGVAYSELAAASPLRPVAFTAGVAVGLLAVLFLLAAVLLRLSSTVGDWVAP
ncbi:MAG: hypothetical protein ABEJ88_00565 [Halobacterium sp.]